MFAAGKTASSIAANYVEDVFSTYLYTGNGSTQTINNNIDLAGKGGMVWTKTRNVANSNWFIDTVRGGTQLIRSNTTEAQFTSAGTSITFGPSSYVVGSDNLNTSTQTQVSWTFRKQPKFFDIVTYTGNSLINRTIPHSLGSVPGCIIIKRLNTTSSWRVQHRSINCVTVGDLRLDSTEAAGNPGLFFPAPANSTDFFVSTNSEVNADGGTYVAYIFAHNAGGFGSTGNDNIISCGSFNSTGALVNVILDYEPQFLLVKRTDAVDDWQVIDNIRGFTTDKDDQILSPNLSSAEINLNPYIGPTAIGFSTAAITAGRTYIYIAIRRPNKVPTVGTSVFQSVARNGTSGVSTPIPATPLLFEPDCLLSFGSNQPNGSPSNPKYFINRLTDGWSLEGNLTTTQQFGPSNPIAYWNRRSKQIDTGAAGNINGNATGTYIDYFFNRAPGFFDNVGYTGTGVVRTVSHSLKAVPELIIIKNRTNDGVNNQPWVVGWLASPNADDSLILNTAAAAPTSAKPDFFSSTRPTSLVFTVGADAATNLNTWTYVAYLFATCPGVSKVGSYTGTGALQTVACGFTSGARFVLIKRTDSTGDWYVWDSARGITSGNDPYLLLNSTAAEVTNTNYVDTDSTGFKLTAAVAALNAVGGTYIFLAIA